MQWRRLRAAAAVAAAAMIVGIDASPIGHDLLRLPSVVTVAAGQIQGIALGLPWPVVLRMSAPPHAALQVDGSTSRGWERASGLVLWVDPTASGDYTVQLRPMGRLVPWPLLHIHAVAAPQVAVGGQSVALLLQVRGAMVTSSNRKRTLRAGDDIVAADGRAATTAVIAAAAAADGAGGRPVILSVMRDGRTLRVSERPTYNALLDRYTLGVGLRTEESGVGTLTFWDPATLRFGALGHEVVDPSSGVPVPAAGGRLLPAVITGVEPSRYGAPGEKLGALPPDAATLGVLSSNTPVGVVGTLLHPLGAAVGGTLPVALPDQASPGPATIYTVLHGGSIGAYSARILAVRTSGSPGDDRALVIQVTDPRLLRISGGIVQGMSGSPIVQDGRVVGAVTHVLIDDPARGYGVFADAMASAAGIGGGPGQGQAHSGATGRAPAASPAAPHAPRSGAGSTPKTTTSSSDSSHARGHATPVGRSNLAGTATSPASPRASAAGVHH